MFAYSSRKLNYNVIYKFLNYIYLLETAPLVSLTYEIDNRSYN